MNQHQLQIAIINFKFQGPNHTVSLDGHDKLCGYQKSMFPWCVYGAQDTFSGKILFLKIWTSNNDSTVENNLD